jgi:flagellar basal body-associated protein FliL
MLWSLWSQWPSLMTASVTAGGVIIVIIVVIVVIVVGIIRIIYAFGQSLIFMEISNMSLKIDECSHAVIQRRTAWGIQGGRKRPQAAHLARGHS